MAPPRLTLLVALLLLLVVPAYSWSLRNGRRFSAVASALLLNIQNPALALSSEPVQVVAAERQSEANFDEFIVRLDKGEFDEVVFYGIRPTYLVATEKGTGKPLLVRDGFPAYDDPLSPSGPQQAIAKVQHTPGTICVQDISEALALSKTAKREGAQRPLVSSSAFPKEYAYTRDEASGTYLVNGNDPKRGQ